MDRALLLAASCFALLAAVGGSAALWRGRRSMLTACWMAAAFVCQSAYLWERGELRGACPLRGNGEIAAYLVWALMLFYLFVGRVYRLSLLGVFSAPLVLVLQGFALWPGVLEEAPKRVGSSSVWNETHAAIAVLAYGALALAAVASVMFLLLNFKLKAAHFQGSLFRNLPPARELVVCIERLLWLGLILLSAGLVAGFLMPQSASALVHLLTACGIWLGYALLLGLQRVRGLTGQQLAVGAVALFAAALAVFVVL